MMQQMRAQQPGHLSNVVRGAQLDLECLGGDIPSVPRGKWLRQRAMKQ